MSVRNYLKQLAQESVVYGTASVLTKVIGFLLLPLLTAVLTPADYGLVALLDSLTGLVSLFAILGLDSAAPRWFYDTEDMEDRKATISTFFWCFFVSSLLLGAGLIAFSRPLARLVLGDASLAHLVSLGALSVPLSTLVGVNWRYLRYRRFAKLAAAFTVVTAVVTTGLAVLFVWVWRYGVEGLLVSRLVALAFGCAVAFVVIRRWIGPRLVSWHRLVSMLRYGLPMVPAGLAIWGLLLASRFIIEWFWNTHEVGLYAVALTVAGGVTLITGAFKEAWVPFALSIYKDERANQVYVHTLDLYSFLSCGLCVGVTIFSPLILRLLTSKDYYSASSCVGFLAFGYMLDGATFVASIGAAIAKTPLPYAVAVSLASVTNIALCFLLVPLLGRDGAGLALLVGYGVCFASLYRASQRQYYIPYRWHVSVILFIFSWLLIAVDRWCIGPAGVLCMIERIGLLLTFIPMVFALRIVRWTHVSALWPSASPTEPPLV